MNDGSRKNPFAGRRGVAHLLRKKAPVEKESKVLTDSQLKYKKIKPKNVAQSRALYKALASATSK